MTENCEELTPEMLDTALTGIMYAFECDVRREGKIVYCIFTDEISNNICEVVEALFSYMFEVKFTVEFIKTKKKIGSKFLCIYDFSKICKNSLDK